MNFDVFLIVMFAALVIAFVAAMQKKNTPASKKATPITQISGFLLSMRP